MSIPLHLLFLHPADKGEIILTKKKLSSRIALYCAAFAFILTLVLSTVGYTAYKTSMLERYESYTRALMDTARSTVDGDALFAETQAGTEGEAYLAARETLCAIKRNSEISYIYMVTFPDASTHRKMNFLMNGFTPEEIAEDPDYISHIGDESVLGEVGDPDADFDYATTLVFWNSLYANETADVQFYVNDTDLYGYQMTGYAPIRTSEGEPVAVLALDLSMDQIKNNLYQYLLIMAVAAILLLAVFLMVLLSVLGKNVIHPVTRLAGSVRDFVKNSESAGDDPEKLTYQHVEVTSGDEIELLSRSISDMTTDLKNYMVNLKTVVGEKERIGAELDLATNIQVSMLPSIFPAFPERPEIDIHATMDPAKEVGGDFYDYFFVDNDHLMVVIADVSGKGVPAALFMVIAKTLIKNNALSGMNPAQVFTRTNDQLCENNGAGLFVTAWACLIEISTGRTIYVNAGHNPPALRRKDGQFEYLRSRPGFVLAGMEGIRYRQAELVLEPGDTLYLYTDGVTEATDHVLTLYGEERLLASLNKLGDTKARDMLEQVTADLNAFVNGADQADDITMVAVKIVSRTQREEA